MEAFVGRLVLILVSVVLRGWTLAVLWGWFVVPLGAHAITIPLALGLSMLVGLFTIDMSQPPATKMQYSFFITLVVSVVLYGVALAVGWFFHLFV